MSEEIKNTENTNPAPVNNANSSQEEERKKQFEKMKEKFSKQPSGFGGKNSGNNFYWIYGLVIVGLLFITFFGTNFSSKMREVSQSKFEQDMLRRGDVIDVNIVNEKIAKITINPDSLSLDRYIDPATSHVYFDKKTPGPHFFLTISKDDFLRRLEKVQDDAGIPKNKQIYPHYSEETSWVNELTWIAPILIMVVLWLVMMRRMSGGSGGPGQIFNIGKSKAVLFDKDTNVNTTFNDVAGLDGAKLEVMEIVDFLKNPKKYTDLGAKIPKGALLVGPPGTGKTLLAKAVAGEAKVPFFSLSGSDFVEMFVGVGASRVRDLFRNAKEKAPCIIFIDEIDAIGRARGKSISAGSNDERENTLNQLLTEMDGFGTNSGVIILAATNRADILDRALMRAGRFDRQIYVDMLTT